MHPMHNNVKRKVHDVHEGVGELACLSEGLDNCFDVFLFLFGERT